LTRDPSRSVTEPPSAVTKSKLQVLQPQMDDALQQGDVVYVRESLF